MKKRTKGVLAAALAAAGVFLLAGLDARLLVRAYTVESGRLTGPVRLAVLTDLHACAYGEGQRELLDAVAEQSPDLVLLCGDIVDDEPRMPEARALDTVEALAAVWFFGVDFHLYAFQVSGIGGGAGYDPVPFTDHSADSKAAVVLITWELGYEVGTPGFSFA